MSEFCTHNFETLIVHSNEYRSSRRTRHFQNIYDVPPFELSFYTYSRVKNYPSDSFFSIFNSFFSSVQLWRKIYPNNHTRKRIQKTFEEFLNDKIFQFPFRVLYVKLQEEVCKRNFSAFINSEQISSLVGIPSTRA